MINERSKLKRNEEKFIANSLGDETIMMHITDGSFIGLNAVGTEIWHLLAETMSFETLINRLMDIYEVPASQCIDETLPYLTNMIGEEMVQIVDN